jgi:hypothetical protein
MTKLYPILEHYNVQEDETAAKYREERDYQNYLETMYEILFRNIPNIQISFDDAEPYLFAEGEGTTSLMWDDVDAINRGECDKDNSLLAFIIWANEDNTDREVFYTMQEAYNWPFDEYCQIEKFPSKRTIKNRLVKMGHEELMPAILYGFYPPHNFFFEINPEMDDSSLLVTQENVEYIFKQYGKIKQLLNDYCDIRDRVNDDPYLLMYLAEAIGMKTESGRRVRA